MSLDAHSQLAVVIPAYKPDFLKQALESLARQTNLQFTVYIGDDASPSDLKTVADAFSSRLSLHYHRFEDNIGSKSLVAQWTRCIDLSNEPWIWLFSDDDEADPDCVQTFHQTLDKTGKAYALYRFNTLVMNSQGQIKAINPPHPDWESVSSFAYHRLLHQRMSFAVEYIFSRQVYKDCGGFIDRPLAWTADEASWMRMAGSGGICTMPGPLVRWRRSALNISGTRNTHLKEKVDALIIHVNWLEEKNLLQKIGPMETTAASRRMLYLHSFYHGINAFGRPLPLSASWHLLRWLRDRAQFSLGFALIFCCTLHIRLFFIRLRSAFGPLYRSSRK